MCRPAGCRKRGDARRVVTSVKLTETTLAPQRQSLRQDVSNGVWVQTGTDGGSQHVDDGHSRRNACSPVLLMMRSSQDSRAGEAMCAETCPLRCHTVDTLDGRPKAEISARTTSVRYWCYGSSVRWR